MIAMPSPSSSSSLNLYCHLLTVTTTCVWWWIITTRCVVVVTATPRQYMESWGPRIKEAVLQEKYLLMDSIGPSLSSSMCGKENNITSAGLMWFTAAGCRVASTALSYVNRNGIFANAESGDIIALGASPGDTVFFPPPQVPDCYFGGRNVCGPDEFCMAERHEKWGPWAMAPTGLGSNRFCAFPYYGFNTTQLNETSLAALNQSVVNTYCAGVTCGADGVCEYFPGWINQVSFSTTSNPQTWRPVRGQCVKYRKRNQSCYMMLPENTFYSDAFMSTSDPLFNDGGGINRPFVCEPELECRDMNGVNTCVDPNDDVQASPRNEWETCSEDLPCAEGLICTGTSSVVMNYTCVVPRAADLCYAGPWWDSASCPRTGRDSDGELPPCGGMTVKFAQESLYATMLLSPGEIVSAGSCDYWYKQLDYTAFDDTAGWPQRLAKLRESIYNIFDTLWPKHLAGFEELIPFQTIEDDVFVMPTATNEQCQLAATAVCEPNDNSEICILQRHHVYIARLIQQPNKVWSLIHWVMTNLKEEEEMTTQQVEASQAIALILHDNFWCSDCRGFFDGGVLGVLGYPPSSTRAIDHEFYWYRGHNEASEHVASVRGSHPWIMQLAGQSSGPVIGTEFQNPFFLTYEDAHLQWKQRPRDINGECPPVNYTVPYPVKDARTSSPSASISQKATFIPGIFHALLLLNTVHYVI